MSIRSRLTLLYTGILTLTLIVFGVALYSIQATDTINSLKQDLIQSSERLKTSSFQNVNTKPPELADGQETTRPPKTFDEISTANEGGIFADLREREIVRILDIDGNLLASPYGRAEDALPLSEEGLSVVQTGEVWWTDDVVSEEHMLIYTFPVTNHDGTVEIIIQVARSLTERDRTLNSLAVTLTAAGAVMVLIAFVIGWAISGMSLRPIDRITQTAKAIGDDRDFTRRVDYDGPPDEVGRLANTFNQMLSRLQAAYQRVEHSLKKQRDFVADVSHELRTPLTTLRGNLGLLRRDPEMPTEDQSDILSDMVEESDRLIRLVNDLLLLARAEAGRSFLTEPIQVLPIIDDTVRQIHLLDPDRDIHVEVPGGLKILGDRDALKQVLLILMDNAVKHSESDVFVSASFSHGEVNIIVEDHGCGISPEVLPHVFDRFYRGEDSASVPGFGLGLPIAKALVEGLGGTISVESEVGVGSRVTLVFRMAK